MYLFRDAGLNDIFIEAGIVAEGSINGVFDGKHYNRAVSSVVVATKPESIRLAILNTLATQSHARYVCE